MATAAEIQTMATDARCFLCVSDKQLIAMQVYLLWLGLNPGGSMTAAEIQTLASDSRCLADCLSQKQLAAAAVLLLFEGGGGGGGGSGGSGGITAAAGAPPTDGSVTTLFYKNTSTGVIYINSGTEAVPVWDAI